VFERNDTVGWVSRKVTYMGRVVSSNVRVTIVLVTSTDKRSGEKYIERRVGVASKNLQRLHLRH
jgi:hypothetical protein